MSTVGEEIQNEIRRVRDVLLPRYDAIPTGKFGALMLRQVLDRATKALAEGDAVAIVRSYAELKECGECIGKMGNKMAATPSVQSTIDDLAMKLRTLVHKHGVTCARLCGQVVPTDRERAQLVAKELESLRSLVDNFQGVLDEERRLASEQIRYLQRQLAEREEDLRRMDTHFSDLETKAASQYKAAEQMRREKDAEIAVLKHAIRDHEECFSPEEHAIAKNATGHVERRATGTSEGECPLCNHVHLGDTWCGVVHGRWGCDCQNKWRDRAIARITEASQPRPADPRLRERVKDEIARTWRKPYEGSGQEVCELLADRILALILGDAPKA